MHCLIHKEAKWLAPISYALGLAMLAAGGRAPKDSTGPAREKRRLKPRHHETLGSVGYKYYSQHNKLW